MLWEEHPCLTQLSRRRAGPLQASTSSRWTKSAKDFLAWSHWTTFSCSWLTAGLEFDVIVANNDEMAIGAMQALKSAGRPMDDVVVAGIDATADGLAALEARDIDVTVFQNTVEQGHVAVRAAVAAAGGTAMEPEAWVPFEPVTAKNPSQYAN
ncbi:substrate-binding domain-containing protein [Paracoccus rhizosphaerae]